MIVGVPKEVLNNEYRVALTPGGAELLVSAGHTVLVEAGAGVGSGYLDGDYEGVGAIIIPEATEIFRLGELIVKVKEPQPQEIKELREGQILFTFLHFAASYELTLAVQNSGCVAIAYETVLAANGTLPLLAPMSEVAGRLAVQQGAKYLEKTQGGAGLLLGGVPGVAPANVLILGGGVVGSNAATIAAGMGAQVAVCDLSLDRLRHLSEIMPANVITIVSNPHNIRKLLFAADLVISCALVPGAHAPALITRSMLQEMRQGSVIVDVAIDQGGSAESSRPTTHQQPVYTVDGVVHYCVTNMPGIVPATSTQALTNATLPYLLKLANLGYKEAIGVDPALRAGVNMVLGNISNENVAKTFNLNYRPLI